MVRVKQRYLFCQLLSAHFSAASRIENQLIKKSNSGHDFLSSFTKQSINKALNSAIALTFGDYGAAVCNSTHVSQYQPETGLFIIKTRRHTVKMVQTSLMFIGSLEKLKFPAVVQTLHISGTLKQLSQWIQKRSQELQLSEPLFWMQVDNVEGQGDDSVQTLEIE